MIKENSRLSVIYGELDECDVLADIGCDHGYILEKALSEGKCKFAVAADVSVLCLKKAEENLRSYNGKFSAVVSDGFVNVPKCDEAVIAGMGGDTILHILADAASLPDKLLVQPMKNADKVRRWLIKNGYKIIKDYTFKDVKFYDLIKAERGDDKYSEDEYIFGRDNLREKGVAFKEFILSKRNVLLNAVSYMDASEREKTLFIINKYEEIIK